jgi:hypothetical protein
VLVACKLTFRIINPLGLPFARQTVLFTTSLDSGSYSLLGNKNCYYDAAEDHGTAEQGVG